MFACYLFVFGGNMSITFADLEKIILTYNKEDINKIRKAYEMANILHQEQVRASGEPYIIHPLAVAYILAEIKADTDTLCAALLHDTLEDTTITKEEIAEEFNQTVATLVDGVTKMSKVFFSSKKEQQLANTRKILIGIKEDVRIILIKLADRLHNMRTLEHKSSYKQKENALETMDIFVPLAHYIGVYQIKSELEDLAFRYLRPEEYSKTEEIKFKFEDESKSLLEEMLYKIKCLLEDKNVPNEIKIRTRGIYSIYRELNEKDVDANIHDLLALKIIVDEIDNCYRTLGAVHSLYHPVNSMFKDYICNPKTNMYQSLHTIVFGEREKLVQVRIRTSRMNEIATYGLTASWNGKEEARIRMQRDLESKYQFFNSLEEIDDMFKDNQEFVNRVRTEILSEKVYVYTLEGDIIELPVGSTPIDFAYKIHTTIGNMMVGVLVNDEEVPMNYVLQNKDRVKIITSDLSKGPQEEWLKLVRTSHARRGIREFKRNN